MNRDGDSCIERMIHVHKRWSMHEGSGPCIGRIVNLQREQELA